MGISELPRQIKFLAKELEVSVIMLSQLNHSAGQRKDGVLQLADLCESGPFGQDADIVIMLHRPELYTQNPTGEERDQAVFHISEHCNGQPDKTNALFRGHYSRFTNQSAATFNPT